MSISDPLMTLLASLGFLASGPAALNDSSCFKFSIIFERHAFIDCSPIIFCFFFLSVVMSG